MAIARETGDQRLRDYINNQKKPGKKKILKKFIKKII
jgi:hypothetical protein